MVKESKIDTELIDKSEIEIERVPQAELDEREENQPHYKEKVDLTEEQIDRLRTEIFKQYKNLKTERDGEHLETSWDERDAQYAGEMVDDSSGIEFNLDTGVTQVKVDGLEKFAAKAFLESEPKFSVTPRPETAKMDKWEVTVQGQSDYLDYKLDEEIDIASPLRKVLHQAVNLDVGFMKIPYAHIIKKKRREEKFSGEIIADEQGQMKQPGLEAFLRQYPDASQPGNAGYGEFQRLVKGKDVVFKADFYQTTYSDPLPSFVDCRDFYAPKNSEGYKGLCDARITIEKQRYTYWELKRAEKNEDFENVDEVQNKINNEADDEKTQDQANEDMDPKDRDYTVMECVYWFNQKEDSDDPDDEIRIVCWFDLKSKAFLGAILYPYDGVECYYVPFYIKDKKAGLYKGGLSEDITDDHLVQNAFINFMLTESWQQLVTTPVVREGSPILDQFQNKRWKPGVPLEIPQNELTLTQNLDFLEKPQRGVGVQLMNMLFFLGKMTDDKTGITSLASGKESPTDPTAPAAKTAMLLKQSGISIGEYINCLLPSFNLVGEIILQLTHQMSEGGRMYRQRQTAGAVTGGNPFGEITRDQMIAKTNIQSQALGFAFDKINEKIEMMSYFQLMRADPILAQNPEGVYTLARILTKAWHPMLKNKIDQLFPSPEEFSKKQFGVAVQALQLYLEGMSKQAQVTGVGAKPDFKEFMQMATQMMAQAVTPPEEKE